MANNVSNKLEIQCHDTGTMTKIKKLIFEEKEEKNQIFTMEVLLPRSMAFADSEHYDLNWNRTVWGTKRDVYDYSVNESGHSITIYYATAWNPNLGWVEVLCCYIDHFLGYESEKNIYNISVKHRYSDYPGNFGGIVEWNPGVKFNYTHYNSYNEYLKNHDKEGYKMIMEAEARMKAGNDEIMTLNTPI